MRTGGPDDGHHRCGRRCPSQSVRGCPSNGPADEPVHCAAAAPSGHQPQSDLSLLLADTAGDGAAVDLPRRQPGRHGGPHRRRQHRHGFRQPARHGFCHARRCGAGCRTGQRAVGLAGRCTGPRVVGRAATAARKSRVRWRARLLTQARPSFAIAQIANNEARFALCA